MSGMIRHFTGSREATRVGAASKVMRIEIMKKGKLPSKDRFKEILKQQMEDTRSKALNKPYKPFSLSNAINDTRKLSKHAEQMLQQIAQKKAKKEHKRLSKMVIVEARNFHNGSINKKGKIYDVAGNVVGTVNTKNGRMSTMTGWSLGRYKPKSYMTNITIQNAIHQFSPYYINLRKQQLAAGGVWAGPMGTGIAGSENQEVINVYGPKANSFENNYGADAAAPRQNVAMTSWGVRSDNVWGSFADNAWGTFADNVWGGNSSDVWGGIGAPSGWGGRGPHIWGTGSGRNYLRGVTKFMAALFGLSTKQNRQRLASLNKAARSGGGSGGTRTSAPVRSAPTKR